MTGIYRPARTAFRPPRTGRGRPRVLRRAAGLSSLAAAAVLVAACGSAGGSSAGSGSGYGGSSGNTGNAGTTGNAAAANSTVSSRQLSGIGKVLVNGAGLTVYRVKTPAETNGHIKCTGSCTSFWLPVTAGSASMSGSGLPGKLGTVHRPGGQTQLTYNGRPLYTFKLDTAPGQAHGNNYTDSFNGTSFTWQAVTASGQPAGSGGGAATPSPSGSSSSSGGGYGY
jgi:predicted lipoprotein with Yx(FWY)xxD motif